MSQQSISGRRVVKHRITFVHPSSTLRPHPITPGLFPIPCLTLVYSTGVTQEQRSSALPIPRSLTFADI